MSEMLLTVEQAAEQLKLHPKTVLRHIRDGRLPAKRIGKAYRIEQSRLDAFAGIASGRPTAPPGARATCIVDVPGLAAADAERIATFLGAVAMTGDADTPPLHLSTAFDPATATLKIVIVGEPFDTGKLLEMLQMQLERR
jgi:excisionase family DNA binding protein